MERRLAAHPPLQLGIGRPRGRNNVSEADWSSKTMESDNDKDNDSNPVTFINRAVQRLTLEIDKRHRINIHELTGHSVT